MTSTYRFQWLGVAITIETDCDEVDVRIVALFGGQIETGTSHVRQNIGCTVQRHADGWSIQWHDGDVQDCSSLAKLMMRLEYRWFMAIQKHHAGKLLFMHASALSLDGRTLLVAGGPDAGKTTLAMCASETGHHAIGDELIAVDPLTMKLSGLRRGLKLNQVHNGTLPLDENAHLLPAHTLHWSAEDWHRLDVIVVLQPDGGPLPIRLSRPNAVQTLYAHCLNSLSFQKGGMQEITLLVEGAPVIELGRTDPNSMITALHNWHPHNTDGHT